MTVAHVFAGGESVSPRRIHEQGPADLVLAADSGAENAVSAGVAVDMLVGDLDSITSETLKKVLAEGTRIEVHSPDKDATDLELTLAAAVRLGADEIVVIGGGGGRLDHLLGNLAALTSRTLRDIPVRWELERQTAYVVHHRRTVPTRPGTTFSVVPVGGDLTGVMLTGSKWELDNAGVEAGSTLGISNIATGDEVRIEMHGGVALVVCVLEE